MTNMRSRPRRPILTAMKNPEPPCCQECAGKRETNPPMGGGGGGGGHHGGFRGGGRGWWGGSYPWWGGYSWPYAYGYNYAQPYAYAQTAAAADVWLPATKGTAPRGATEWVLWTGGSTGTRVRAGGLGPNMQVQILETAKGGVTGTLVRVAPAPALPVAPVYQPGYAYGYPAAVAVRRF